MPTTEGVNKQGRAYSLAAVTTSDSADNIYDAIWVGTGGNLAVMGANDTSAVTLGSVASGTLLPISVRKIMTTNTTASAIVGLKVAGF